MNSRSGLSLLELVVALGLLALVVPVLVSLLPVSHMARRKAETLQTATALAQQWLEEARAQPPAAAGVDREQVIPINGVKFTARREVFEPTPEAFDVVVTMECPPHPSIRLATRIARP